MHYLSWLEKIPQKSLGESSETYSKRCDEWMMERELHFSADEATQKEYERRIQAILVEVDKLAAKK
jgi:hypothetical protein